MEQDWNGIKIYPNRSEIINAVDDVVVVVYGEHHHRDARRILNLVDEVARLREHLSDAVTRGLMIYHIASDHNGLAKDCQTPGCQLERRSMAALISG